MDVRGRSRIERSDEDLVFELITEHLAPVLRAASETEIQDTAAFAIQELLKLHGCQGAVPGRRSATGTSRASHPRSAKSSTSINELGEGSTGTIDSGEKLWHSFPDDVKEIITPCLTSKFLLQQIHPTRGASVTGPLFRPGMPFRRWMYLWIKRLISQASKASKASGNRADIFAACGGVVRHDMGTALFLLPYLVLNVVCDGSNEARTGVTQEILTVLATGESLISSVTHASSSSFIDIWTLRVDSLSHTSVAFSLSVL